MQKINQWTALAEYLGNERVSGCELLKERILELLRNGTVQRVLGWKKGDMSWNPEVSFFDTEASLEEFVYDGFCGANLSKYMIEASKWEGRTLICLKPCDTYSFNQLLKEHRIDREKAYIIGVGCKGKLDLEKVKKAGGNAESCSGKEYLLDRCYVCKGKEHKILDEQIGDSEDTATKDRFEEVRKIEAMKPEERFAFFQQELSKCIRCNACRNVCPVCSCRKCVFDGGQFNSVQKANSDPFEEKMFHIIRAFHVAGRCTDCGECSRVCPQGIPLHLFNRKFIKDINEWYGTYQAGADIQEKAPLTSFSYDDAEPGNAEERG